MPNLLFVVGSLRQASSAKAMARAMIRRLDPGVSAHIADIGGLPHYNADLVDNAAVKTFLDDIAKANGLVFVTPEYNYGVPGVLKNAIDWASRPAYESVLKGKPCFMVSTSGGALGGVRAQAQLKYMLNAVLAELHLGREIVVPFANDKVKDGLLEDEAILAFTAESLRAFITALPSS
jgi:chromate reductase, NAD(P)H dehydrogenase (quinone)